MSSLKAQIVGGDEPLKGKGNSLFNCLDDILMANETSIVLPMGVRDMHPIVLVEPKIEIKVELKNTRSSPAEQQIFENLLQVPESGFSYKKSNSVRSANGGSVSPHSNCSNDSTSSATRRHHHHRHHHHRESETNKENNVPSGGGLETLAEEDGANGEGEVKHRHHKHHHHRHHHHHHHHHSQATNTTAAQAAVGVNGEVLVPRPDQVLRKYIIKKITIRKQDGSTKKIVIKKPVDEPNGPVKLTKVDNCSVAEWWDVRL